MAKETDDPFAILQGLADSIRRSKLDVDNAYAIVLELGRSFAAQLKPKGINPS